MLCNTNCLTHYITKLRNGSTYFSPISNINFLPSEFQRQGSNIKSCLWY